MIMNGLSQGGGSDSRVPVIYTTSYVGTGTYGQKNPNILTFDFVPEMVVISSDHYYYTTNQTPHPKFYDPKSALILTPHMKNFTNVMVDSQLGEYWWIHATYTLALTEDKKTWVFYANPSCAAIKIVNGSSQFLFAGNGQNAKTQYNLSTATYYVTAIGYKEEA